MRVAVAEDNQVYRAGLVKLLSAAGADVAHEAASANEMLARLSSGPAPDAVLMDVRMAGRDDDGIVGAERLAQQLPGVGVLLLTAFADVGIARRLFAAGSAGKGYMLKDSLNSVRELSAALERVATAGTYCDPAIVDQLLARPSARPPGPTFTAREDAVLRLLVGGASNTAIAEQTRSTVGATEAAISALYNKLGIPDSRQHNRRVLAVLDWLQRAQTDQPADGPLP